MKAAEGVLQGMLRRAAGHALHKAGQGIGQGHHGPGLLVLSVLYRPGQVGADELDGLDGEHIADGGDVVGDIAFGGVEEGVKALIGRQVGRDALHQIRVDNGKGRVGHIAAEADFLPRLLLGDNRPGVGLGAGAGGGGDGYDGQGMLFQGLVFAAAPVDVVPVVAVVDSHDGDGLGRVDAGAAPQADDKVAARLLGQGRPLHHMGLHRVGQDFIENLVSGPILFQQLLHPFQIAVPAHGGAGGYDNQGLFAGQGLLPQLIQGAGAEKQFGRHKIGKLFHCKFLLDWDNRCMLSPKTVIDAFVISGAQANEDAIGNPMASFSSPFGLG